MSTISETRPAVVPRRALRHAAWFVFGSAVAFAVPYLGVSVLDLQHDVYYLLYFAVTLALVGGYAYVESVDVADLFRRQWRWSLILGVLVGVFVVWNVLSSDSTARPTGVYFVFELAWRGVGYGAIDALLMTAFPGAVAYNMLRGQVHGLLGRLRYVALALPLILIITAMCHLGYPQYREDGIGRPEFGNTMISIPMLATTNPAGSVLAHVSMHVTAVTHCYETPVFLPPETKA